MNSSDRDLYKILSNELDSTKLDLSILNDPAHKDVLIRQLIDSARRVKYATTVKDLNNITESSASIDSNCFDPIRAAVFHNRQGNVDEAVWLIFLSIHFGYSPTCKWLLVKDFYSGLGGNIVWNWESINNHRSKFISWAQGFQNQVSSLIPKRKFGNHRKYESLNPDASRSLAGVVDSYVQLIAPYKGHQAMFDFLSDRCEGCRYRKFDYLYNYFSEILSFGRTARFDFITMIGKLGICDLEPPKTYMKGATGPVAGARLLFGFKNETARELECKLAELNNELSISPFGMQVLEDALCNWQKSPQQYIHFKG